MTDVLVPMTLPDLVLWYSELSAALATSDNEKKRSDLGRRCDMLKRQIACVSTDAEIQASAVSLERAFQDLQNLRSDLQAAEQRQDWGPSYIALSRAYIDVLGHIEAIKAQLEEIAAKNEITNASH